MEPAVISALTIQVNQNHQPSAIDEEQKLTQNHQSIHEIPTTAPSILLNPSLKHLSNRPLDHHKKSNPSNRPVGKRRKQRLDNARFTSNPHISRPTQTDFQLWHPDPQITFPTPPPKGYPRSLYIPPAEPIPVDQFSSTMGAFNRSLKGVRKTMRRLIGDEQTDLNTRGPIEEILIKIDDRLANWIDGHTIWKSSETDRLPKIIDPNPWPAMNPIRNQPIVERSLSHLPSIVELSSSPQMLTWDVPNPFGRYLVHCVARYYGIVSFSRPQSTVPSLSTLDSAQPQGHHPTDSERTIVCMIKAHFPTRRGQRVDGHQSLDTPPATDDSELSGLEVLSEGSNEISDDDHDERSRKIQTPLRPGLSHLNPLSQTRHFSSSDPLAVDASSDASSSPKGQPLELIDGPQRPLGPDWRPKSVERAGASVSCSFVNSTLVETKKVSFLDWIRST